MLVSQLPTASRSWRVEVLVFFSSWPPITTCLFQGFNLACLSVLYGGVVGSVVFGGLGVILASLEGLVWGYRSSSKSDIRGKTRSSRTEYKNLLTRGTVARMTERLRIALDSYHQQCNHLNFCMNMISEGVDGIVWYRLRAFMIDVENTYWLSSTKEMLSPDEVWCQYCVFFQSLGYYSQVWSGDSMTIARTINWPIPTRGILVSMRMSLLRLWWEICTYMIRDPNRIMTMIRSCLGMLTFQTGRMAHTERMTSVTMLNIVIAYCKLPRKGQLGNKNVQGFGKLHWNATANREKIIHETTATMKL